MTTEVNDSSQKLFNLLDENWIPVLYHTGVWKHIGIKKILEDAGNIRQIASSNPMDRIAVIRFLLSIVYWCHGNPPEHIPDSFLSDCIPKLEEYREAFNLLGDGKRFYQDSQAQRKRPATELFQEIPVGNNFWHFRHSTDYVSGMCPACCALGLLRLPLFTLSGLPDLKSGINGAPPIYVYESGNNLYDTLDVNWCYRENIGKPAWDNLDSTSSFEESIPLLYGLTLLSRRVWLDSSSVSEGKCINCGMKSRLIQICEFQSAGTQETDKWIDPNVVYFVAKDGKRKTVKAKDLSSTGIFKKDRPIENIMSGMFERTVVPSHGDSLNLVGLATDKAKYIDVWVSDIANLHIEQLESGQVDLINNWDSEGRRLEWRLGQSKELGQVLVTSIRPHVESQVALHLSELLMGEGKDWGEMSNLYRPFMNAIAKANSPGYSTTDVANRNRISNTIPDMSSERIESLKNKGKK